MLPIEKTEALTKTMLLRMLRIVRRDRMAPLGALAASVQDVSAFSGPREFAAFLGLTPRQNSSRGKERLGRISKMGNRYCGNCSSWARMRSSIIASRTKTRCDPGQRNSCRPSPSSLSPSRSPIKWCASPSRLCAAGQPIAQLRCNERRHRQRPRAAKESRVTKR
jgi:hypothetical protein